MDDFVIITNRKRAIIALIHSVFFLLIAIYSVLTSRSTAGLMLHHHMVTSALVAVMIYLIVTSVLIVLASVSRRTKERLYFGFCATSAGVGLLRALFGDPVIHGGQYLRVLMLVCAVFTGTVILRTHAAPAAPGESPA